MTTVMKRICSIIVVMGLLTMLTLLLAACGQSATADGPNQVHMSDSSFDQSSITIKKGESIALVNDTAEVHIIENGTWDSNGNARSEQEPGAPTVNAEVDGFVTKNVGPFNTAGTFHLYCTVHPGMKLTVVVNP
jgi:plastocyanin